MRILSSRYLFTVLSCFYFARSFVHSFQLAKLPFNRLVNCLSFRAPASSQVIRQTSQLKFTASIETDPSKGMVWWIVNHKLGGCPKPTEEELQEYKKKGLTGVVSLLEDGDIVALYQKHHVPHLWLPVTSGMAPSMDQLQELKSFVDSHSTEGKGHVLVHCKYGNSRTGTMLIGYLMLSGQSYDAAKDHAMKANPSLNLSDEQDGFLVELSKNLEQK
jgi:atypical dual specificity phosphatase